MFKSRYTPTEKLGHIQKIFLYAKQSCYIYIESTKRVCINYCHAVIDRQIIKGTVRNSPSLPQ